MGLNMRGWFEGVIPSVLNRDRIRPAGLPGPGIGMGMGVGCLNITRRTAWMGVWGGWMILTVSTVEGMLCCRLERREVEFR